MTGAVRSGARMTCRPFGRSNSVNSTRGIAEDAAGRVVSVVVEAAAVAAGGSRKSAASASKSAATARSEDFGAGESSMRAALKRRCRGAANRGGRAGAGLAPVFREEARSAVVRRFRGQPRQAARLLYSPLRGEMTHRIKLLLSPAPLPKPGGRPPNFSWLSAFLLLMPLLASLAPVVAARADETLRRVQEELRRRNLYYGDIDGEQSRATAGALRRYQERKGFPTSGQLDEITLRSLNVEPTLITTGSSDAASGSGGGSPTGIILKSDRAGRPKPAGAGSASDDEKLFSNDITNFSRTDTGAGATATAAATPALAAPPPPPRATVLRPAVEKPLTLDESRRFIEDYLRAGEGNRLDEELKFYADQVNYFNQGIVDRAFIRRDVQRYYRRWPKRKFELLEPFVMAPGPRENETTVRFLIHYRYERETRRGKPPTRVEGRTDNIFVLHGSEPGAVRIIAMREKRTGA